MKDYQLVIRVKNNWLLTVMARKGFTTATSLSLASGVNKTVIGHFLNLTRPLCSKNGGWRPAVIRLSEVLGCLPEDLAPPQHRETALEKNIAKFEVSMDELASLTDQNRDHNPLALLETSQRKDTINHAMNMRLTPRETRAVELVFGLNGNDEHTMVQAAEIFGVHKVRINQIVHKALGKLGGQRPPSSGHLTKRSTPTERAEWLRKKLGSKDALNRLKLEAAP